MSEFFRSPQRSRAVRYLAAFTVFGSAIFGCGNLSGNEDTSTTSTTLLTAAEYAAQYGGNAIQLPLNPTDLVDAKRYCNDIKEAIGDTKPVLEFKLPRAIVYCPINSFGFSLEPDNSRTSQEGLHQQMCTVASSARKLIEVAPSQGATGSVQACFIEAA